MKNFERYKNITSEQYEKKGLSYFLLRKPSDRKILPIINSIKNKTVCDVGCGTGYYSKFFLRNNNSVIGIDQNPHLCKLSIELFKEDATKFSNKLANRKIDIVFSGWLTEYLNRDELLDFLKESYKVLAKDGILITTIINNKGLGCFYVKLAKRIKGIDKYCYDLKIVNKLLNEAEFKNLRIIDLNAWFGIPCAYLVLAKKEYLIKKD